VELDEKEEFAVLVEDLDDLVERLFLL